MMPPGVAELVGCDRGGREAGRRLRLKEPEARAHLTRRERAQADVVDLHEQQDAFSSQRGWTSHWHVANNHAELSLEIDAVRLVERRDLVVRAEHVVGATLIHQRDALDVRDRRQLECLLHQRPVIQERRAVAPLRRPRQRRGGLPWIEIEGAVQPAFVELFGQRLQAGRRHAPGLDRGEERRGDRPGIGGPRQVARDDDQTPVLAAVFERSEFHAVLRWSERVPSGSRG